MVSSSHAPEGTDNPLDEPNTVAKLVHYHTPTLAHLIGLLCKPVASSIPSGTSLLVIDGLSGLINHAFPKNLEPRQTPKGSQLQKQVHLSSLMSTLII
jgi:hypothetical protein